MNEGNGWTDWSNSEETEIYFLFDLDKMKIFIYSNDQKRLTITDKGTAEEKIIEGVKTTVMDMKAIDQSKEEVELMMLIAQDERYDHSMLIKQLFGSSGFMLWYSFQFVDYEDVPFLDRTEFEIVNSDYSPNLDSYYEFTDGGKCKKSEWLTDEVINVFSELSNASRQEIINILDCSMSKLALQHPLTKVQPLLESGHKNGTDFSVDLFNEIGMMDNLNSCSKMYIGLSFEEGMKDINGHSNELIDYSTGGKDVWVSQLKYTLQQDPEFDQFNDAVDVDKYCSCIVDDFWSSSYFKAENYSEYWESTQYDNAVESCISMSLK